MRTIIVGFQFFIKKKKKREMEHAFSIKMHFTNPKWLTKSIPISSLKKCHFDTSKTNFIILTHHFTTYHLSDVLYYNSIH